MGRRASWKGRGAGVIRKYQDFDKFIAYLKEKKKRGKREREKKSKSKRPGNPRTMSHFPGKLLPELQLILEGVVVMNGAVWITGL